MTLMVSRDGEYGSVKQGSAKHHSKNYNSPLGNRCFWNRVCRVPVWRTHIRRLKYLTTLIFNSKIKIKWTVAIRYIFIYKLRYHFFDEVERWPIIYYIIDCYRSPITLVSTVESMMGENIFLHIPTDSGSLSQIIITNCDPGIILGGGPS